MQQNLIVNNNNNNNNEQENLMKEIKKMSYIKILILIFSITRFIILYFLIFLIIFFPRTFIPNILTLTLFLFILLFEPIFTICFLVIIISGLINRDFWIKKKNNMSLGYFICFCFCFISKNVSKLKSSILMNGVINLLWSLTLLYYFIKDSFHKNNSKFFPYIYERVLYRIILYFVDSFLLFGLFYFFHYFEYFLNRVEKYLEFYKRLIIKNRNKEAEFVGNTLPYNIEAYISNNGNGEELQNI